MKIESNFIHSICRPFLKFHVLNPLYAWTKTHLEAFLAKLHYCYLKPTFRSYIIAGTVGPIAFGLNLKNLITINILL